jgi:hypothetical protein
VSRFLIITSLFLLLFSSCAEQRALSGGPKDTQPPRLDSSRYSTPNLQTNFREKEIILTFDEWVVLNDPTNQIIISPPLQSRPDVKIKHKSVVLKFKEELQANTTYSIQFGESVKDYTENNPAQNLRFVFSTGPVLDSLTLSGQVNDALTATPVEKVWVMMYEGTDDSLPYKERPLYIAKTDAQGFFKFENIREGNFKVFALADNNNNYKYDQRSEMIAFVPEPIFLSDSTQGVLKLRLFKEDEPLALLSSKLIDKNRYRIQFNRQLLDSIIVGTLPENPAFEFLIEKGKDTLLFWWKNADSANVLLSVPALNFRDTIQINNGEEGNWPEKALVYSAAVTAVAAKTKGKPEEKTFNLHPLNAAEVDYSRPIKEIDFSKIILLDSMSAIKIQGKKLENHPRRFTIKPEESPKSDIVELFLLPGAVIDYWGETNRDTLKRTFKVLREKDLGNLKMKIVNADSNSTYIVRLLDDKESILFESILKDKSSMDYEFKLLEPGRYTVEIVQDSDANGRYSPGNYLEKRQPETVTRSKPISLRADWDNEMELDLNPVMKKKGK